MQIPYLTRTAEPEAEPVTLTEAKLYLRVDVENEDSLITHLIKTARQTAEEYLAKSIVTQSWRLQFDFYTPETVNLPRSPVQTVDSVKIIAQDFSETTLSISAYKLNAGKEQIFFSAAPLGQIIQINYTCGYGLAANVPATIKHGILEHVAYMFEKRGEEELPQNVRKLLAPYKTVRV